VAIADTVKEVDGDVVTATLDRDRLVAVQTPQAFDAPALRRAHEQAPEASDDAALIEAAGGRVVIVPGDPRNAKITTPVDLAVARAVLNHDA
jgi:2-C-methyl-D-erythritol 4-phosphate cytidylyltransferase